jgi:hypothetical protein
VDGEMKRLKKYLTFEVDIATTIKDKMVDTNLWQKNKLRKFATLLRIPRLHHEYIEKNGILDFIEYSQDIIRKEHNLK